MLKKIYQKMIMIIARISPKLATKICYYVACKKKLNLKEPMDFNEKVQWLKLNYYYKNPLVTQCADKYAVREYIKEKGCSEILNELIGVYDSASEIDWEGLPDKFALKCNHGCGYNIICDDKRTLNVEQAKARLDKWLNTKFYLKSAEMNYKYITPRIVCEAYLESDDGFLPNDYKIYCFDGEPKIIQGCSDRDTGVKRGFYDIDWNMTDIGRTSKEREEIRKPQQLDKMLEYSRILTAGIKFVRIDFYEVNGKIYFGEMTFTPMAGLADCFSEYGLRYLGDLIEL